MEARALLESLETTELKVKKAYQLVDLITNNIENECAPTIMQTNIEPILPPLGN